MTGTRRLSPPAASTTRTRNSRSNRERLRSTTAPASTPERARRKKPASTMVAQTVFTTLAGSTPEPRRRTSPRSSTIRTARFSTRSSGSPLQVCATSARPLTARTESAGPRWTHFASPRQRWRYRDRAPRTMGAAVHEQRSRSLICSKVAVGAVLRERAPLASSAQKWRQPDRIKPFTGLH
jgi:hypothetical protein